MLTPELQKKIDEKWDACWPISLLKPIAILDLISYLYFLRKISENQLIREKIEDQTDSSLFHSKEDTAIEKIASGEKHENEVQALLTSENGSIELIKSYAKSLAFGVFVKGGLLISPTQKLLANVVALMKIINDEPGNQKGDVFEYLLNKKELTGPNGQAYLPEYLVSLMVSIVDPNEKDFILDASVGNGSLLVASAKYIASKNLKLNNPDSRKFAGLESDLTSLRIAGMNMILHGINNPELKVLDTLSGLGSVTIDRPTVIVANLIFSGDEGRMIVEGSSIKEATRKEILYLNFIIKNAGPGARIVALVPDSMLYSNGAEFLATRQEIMDRFKVKAVISLNDKTLTQFFGASILVFSKDAPAIGGKVWFYKMEHCNTLVPGNEEEFADIINHFSIDTNMKDRENPDSFYIDARDIRAKNYNLNYSEYSLFIDQEKAIHLSEISSDEKKMAMASLRNQTQFRAAEILPEPKKSYRKKVIFISCLSLILLGAGFGVYWFWYLKKDFFVSKQHEITKNVDANSNQQVSVATVVPGAKPDVKSDTNSVENKGDTDKIQSNFKAPNTRYEVVADKAYFYYAADTGKPRNLYLVHAVLTPIKEENGFIYVIYVNKRGESTRGWLNKKDLKPLQ